MFACGERLANLCLLCRPLSDMTPPGSRRSLGAASSHSLHTNGDNGLILGASAEETDNVALMEDVPKNKQVGGIFSL